MFNRFIPSICAVIALIGCFVPLKGSLVMLPTGYNLTFTTSGNPMFAELLKGMVHGLDTAEPMLDLAWRLSLLVYLVPLSAFAIVLLNLRGYVSRSLQIGVAIVWLSLGIGLPMITSTIALQGFRKVSMMGMNLPINPSAVFDLDAGDWMILLASLALLMAGFGLLKYVDTRPQQSPAGS